MPSETVGLRLSVIAHLVSVLVWEALWVAKMGTKTSDDVGLNAGCLPQRWLSLFVANS